MSSAEGAPGAPQRWLEVTGSAELRAAVDRVIPAELQARTWSWLHDASGARLTSRRDPGGHALSPATVTALGEWITGLDQPAGR